MRRSIFPALLVLAAGSTLTFLAGSGCGGGASTAPGPAATPTAESANKDPKVIIEDSTETWYEEESGKPGDKGTSVREYVLDVTKEDGVKGPFSADAGAPKVKIYRVAIRFPVPKVQPPDARDVHATNRLLWEVRKEMAKCFYKGPGKDPGAELSMVGWLAVNKKGEVTGSGVEKSDAALKAAGGFEDCIMENVKGLAFSAAGDDVKIRFKLKLQTLDVTGSTDVKAPPPVKK
jgi:hypothetical protein